MMMNDVICGLQKSDALRSSLQERSSVDARSQSVVQMSGTVSTNFSTNQLSCCLQMITENIFLLLRTIINFDFSRQRIAHSQSICYIHSLHMTGHQNKN